MISALAKRVIGATTLTLGTNLTTTTVQALARGASIEVSKQVHKSAALLTCMIYFRITFYAFKLIFAS